MLKNHRRIMVTFVILVFICSLTSGCAVKNTESVSADNATASSVQLSLNKDNIMKTVEELTSEKYAGRLAGTVENQMAAQYIADYFKEIGLHAPEGLSDYMQPYVQPTIVLKDSPLLQIVDKKGKVLKDFIYSKNFTLRRLSSETDSVDINADMYLVEDSTMLSSTNKDLKGKILLIPWKHYNLLNGQNNPADFAEMYGASAVIGEFDLVSNTLGYNYLKMRPLAEEWMTRKSYKPFAFVDSNTFSLLTEAANKGSKLHFSCSSTVNMKNSVNNVVGLIPGSDPELKDKHIIIGAHFDHVGDNLNGSYNPGALDNGTGVAVMLELARAICENKMPPKQTILFAAFNGEESGLCGAFHYASEPVIPLSDAVMINLDMIGSASKIPLTIAVATPNSKKSLSEDLAACAEKLGIEYVKDYEDASDHSAFDRYGIPAVCLINMDLKYGYHSSHDTMEAVDEERVYEIAELVKSYIINNAYRQE